MSEAGSLVHRAAAGRVLLSWKVNINGAILALR